MFSLWKVRRTSKSFQVGYLFLLSFAFVQCSAPSFDISTEEGRRALKDEVNILLTNEECQQAISLITTLYNSEWSDDEARILFASAHACHASIDFFEVLRDLIDNASNLTGTGMFSTISNLFKPKTGDDVFKIDSRLESSYLASEALMSVLDTGVTIPSQYSINSGTNNPGSLIAENRTAEANLNLFMVSLATLGHTQHRRGGASTNGLQTVTFPFRLEAGLDGTNVEEKSGCAYASALLNMIDGIDGSLDEIGGTAATTLQSLSDTLKNGITIGADTYGINTACAYGCLGQNETNTALVDASCDPATTTFVDGDCNPCPAGDTDCVQCPIALRDRDACETDLYASCAAAGIVRFADTVWQDE